MTPEPDLPTANSPAVQEPFDEWPQRRHQRRKRRRFSRRKTKKVVKITLIVALHVILIAVLIYIWTKIAYSSAQVRTPKDNSFVVVVCSVPANVGPRYGGSRSSEDVLLPINEFRACSTLSVESLTLAVEGTI